MLPKVLLAAAGLQSAVFIVYSTCAEEHTDATMLHLAAMDTITAKRAICATLANNVMGVVLETSTRVS
jgi:hypothetical protein